MVSIISPFLWYPRAHRGLDRGGGRHHRADRGRPLLADATRVAMHDAALLPLYWIKLYWASRGNVTFQANMSEDSSVSFAGIAK